MRTGRTIPDKERLLSFARHHAQGACLSLLAIVFLVSRPEVSFYLFLYSSGFLYGHLFYEKKWNWLRKLLVAPFFSAAALILVCGVADITGVPIGVWCVYVVWCGSAVIAALVPLNITVREVSNYRSYLLEIGIAAIFIVGLAARVIPVWNDAAPILHDPVAHAEWAKAIVQAGRVERFYSPGLHFNIAMSVLTTTASWARSTLMITQFFNALVGVAAAVFLMEFLKDKWWAFLAAAVFTVGSYPATFYTGAGKNSLVFTTGFLFITWAISRADISAVRKIVLCNLMLLATILSHYPAAFVCCLGLAVMLLVSTDKKQAALAMGFAVLVGLLWGATKLPYRIASEDASQFLRESRHESLRQIVTWPRFQQEVVKYAGTLRDEFLVTDRNYGAALPLVGLLATIFVAVQDRRYWFFPIAHLLNNALIAVGRVFYLVSHLAAITSGQMLLVYLFNYLFLSFALSLLAFRMWENRAVKLQAVSTAIVLAIVVNGAIALGASYTYYQRTFRVVQPSDLEAFEWMRAHLDPSDKILVDARIYESSTKTVVFGGDSGVWIPVYTDFVISADFSEGFDYRTYQATRLYLRLANDSTNCRLRSRVLADGYKYYFRGSNPAHAQPMAVTSDGFDLIYENGPVRIYRILGCGQGET